MNHAHLAELEAREKVVFYREEVSAKRHQRVPLGHFLQLERVEVPVIHLIRRVPGVDSDNAFYVRVGDSIDNNAVLKVRNIKSHGFL